MTASFVCFDTHREFVTSGNRFGTGEGGEEGGFADTGKANERHTSVTVAGHAKAFGTTTPTTGLFDKQFVAQAGQFGL